MESGCTCRGGSNGSRSCISGTRGSSNSGIRSSSGRYLGGGGGSSISSNSRRHMPYSYDRRDYRAAPHPHGQDGGAVPHRPFPSAPTPSLLAVVFFGLLLLRNCGLAQSSVLLPSGVRDVAASTQWLRSPEREAGGKAGARASEVEGAGVKVEALEEQHQDWNRQPIDIQQRRDQQQQQQRRWRRRLDGSQPGLKQQWPETGFGDSQRRLYFDGRGEGSGGDGSSSSSTSTSSSTTTTTTSSSSSMHAEPILPRYFSRDLEGTPWDEEEGERGEDEEEEQEHESGGEGRRGEEADLWRGAAGLLGSDALSRRELRRLAYHGRDGAGDEDVEKGEGEGEGGEVGRAGVPSRVLSSTFRPDRNSRRMIFPTCPWGDSCTVRIVARGNGVKGIEFNRKGVVWKGWGTNLAWAARTLAMLANSTLKSQILDALFDKRKGMGLNVVRYNIPSGFNPSHTKQARDHPDKFVRGFNYWGWKYDWSADMQQRWVLTEGLRRGVDTVDAICYSPPWWMTVSKDVSGAKSCRGCRPLPNLAKKNFHRYARFLADVTQFFKRWGINFENLSPFNEALEGWWQSGVHHEANSMTVPGMLAVAARLKKELLKRRMGRTVVSLGDSWPDYTVKLINTINRLGNRARRRTLSRALGLVSVHGYQNPYRTELFADIRYYTAARNAAWRMGKPIWQTEWGPLGVRGFTDSATAMLMARAICQHVNHMGVEVWMHWLAFQPCWGPCGWWGAIHLQKWNRGMNLTKQYYAMLHFTRYMPKGSWPLAMRPTLGHSFLAVYVPQKRRLVIHAVNQKQKQWAYVAFPVSGFKARSDGEWPKLSMYRTSERENFQEVWEPQRDERAKDMLRRGLVTALPPNSLSTFVLDGVDPLRK